MINGSENSIYLGVYAPVVFTAEDEMEDEMEDGGPIFFCATCFVKLHYRKDRIIILIFSIGVLRDVRDLLVSSR